jgi:hypothetical protein
MDNDELLPGAADAVASVLHQDTTSTIAQIRNNVQFSLDANPDTEARFKHLATTAGVPIDTARAQPDEIKRQAAMAQFDAGKVATNYPHLAQFLTNLDNTRMIHDDVPGTANLETAAKALPPAPAADPDAMPPASTPSTVLANAIHYIFSTPGAGDTLVGDVGKVLTGGMRTLAGTGKYLTLANVTLNRPIDALFGTHGVESQLAYTKQLEDYSQSGPTKTAPFKDRLLDVVGSTAGVLAEAVLTGGQSVETRVGATATQALTAHIAHGVQAMMVPAAVASQDTYNSVLQQTQDPTAASSAALMSYVTTTLGGVVPFATPGKLGYRMTSGALMGPLLGDASHQAMNLALPASMQEPDRTGQDRALDAIMGTMFGGMAGPHDLASVHQRMTDAARQSYADIINNQADVQSIQALHGLGQVSVLAKLRERDPDAFKAFVDQVTDDGYLKDIYVNGKVLADALHQSGVTLPDLQATLPELPARITEALQTNGDVRLSVPDYATHLAGTPIDEAILQHLKTTPEGNTYAEAQHFYQTQVEQLQVKAAQILADQADAKAAQVEADHVHDQILQQISATGRFRPEVNQAYAALTRDFYVTQAERTGMTPSELWAKNPVRIDSEPLQGGLEQANRGSFDPETRTISLLKDADLSTYLHESGHFFLETMHALAAHPDAPEGIKGDFDTLLQSFGEKGATPEERLTGWNDKTLDEKRAGHEQFARGFESYLMEGKAPSLALQGVFSRFRSWLLHIYKSLTNLRVDLTPEVRGVMDRMLASDSAIAEAEAIRGYKPLFETAEQAGMSPEDFAAYRDLGKQSTSDAITAMQARSVRDMRWLSNAKSRFMKDLQAKADTARKAIREQVTKEVMSEPVNQARTWLRKGEMIDAQGNEVKAEKGFRLNTGDLKAMYPEGMLGRPDLTGLKGMTSTDGLHPDIVAEMFGFGSGGDLVNALLGAENVKEKIEGMTDQRMLEQHGDLVDQPSIERAAEAAIHNEARARFMATGLKALTKAPIPASQIHEAARQAATNAINGKKIGDLRPAQYAAAEARNNKAALKLAPKDTQGAIDAQRAALLNNQLFKQANEAVTFVEKSLNYLKKFDKQTIRDKMDGAFLERIDQIRATLDLRRSPTAENRAQESLLTWAEGLRNLGYEPQIADWLNLMATPMHYKDATVEQFRGVVDAVKSIEHIAREMKQVTVDGKKIAVKEAVDVLKARMDERGQKFSKADLLEKPTAKVDGIWTTATHWLGVHLRMVHGDLLTPEFKINKFDMHELAGPFRKMILDPILAGNYRKVDLTKRQSDMAAKMGEKLGHDWQKSLYDSVPNHTLVDPELGTPTVPVLMKMTRGRMLGIARHVGNESNFEKLTKGYGWKGEDVWAFLDANMTAKDWQATQAHWDSFDPLWKESEDMIRRQGGVPPPKIPAREFNTRFGAMRGGYSPIDYDPLRSRLAVRHGEFDLGPGDKIGEQMNYRATTTQNSSMVARAQGYTDRINLDFHSAEGRIRDTIHDLAYREALLDVGKIINDAGFRQKFMETYGREEYQALTDWLKGVRDMNSSDPRNRGFEKAMQYGRQGVVLTGIGYRISTVLKHGGAAALKSLGYLGNAEGAKYFAARVARMASGHLQEDIAAAREKFPEIRARMLQMDRDYKVGNRSMYESEGWREKNDRYGHAMVAWSDALSAVPTAWAAYDLARTSGVPESMGGTGKPMGEAQAVNYANSVVRQAHGSALESTRSNFMQAGSIKGFFGALYGFMNNTYGQTADMLDKSVSQGYFRNNPAVAARLTATLLIPAIWTQWLKDSGPGDDDHWYTWMGKAIAAETGAMVPFVRDAVSLLEYGRSNQIAPLQMVTDVTTSAKDFWEEANGKQTRIVQDLANTIGEWAHIAGLGQLGHILQYMRDTSEGKKHQDNPALAVKEAVVGGHAKH